MEENKINIRIKMIQWSAKINEMRERKAKAT